MSRTAVNRMGGAWLVVTLGASSLPAHTIGLYTTADPPPPVQATPPVQNEMSLPPATPTPLYIVAHSSGTFPLESGIAGAEFAVYGVPDTNDLLVNWQANPVANVALGNPFDGGANLAFPGCAPQSSNQAVLLYSAQLIAIHPVANLTLSVGPHSTPSNPNFAYAQLLGCNTPVFPVVEATGVSITINPPIAVRQATWTATKRLYR